jgi:imidazolonepropionase-like amidohydrolase
MRSGITSVRDAGGRIEALQALEAAAGASWIETTRLFACGQMLTATGGHGYGIDAGRGCDGPWEWRKAVRETFRDGFRHIKISPTYTAEEIAAAVDEAKTLGLRITAHGGGLSDTTPTSMTRIAVKAGVQCIEHVNKMEDDVLELIADKGVFLVPTLAIYREMYRRKEIARTLIEDRHWTQAMHETLFRKARALAITMGIGTDAVHSYGSLNPGLYFDEMRYFVDLGATPLEAIVCATRNGALILGQEKKLGTLEAGKAADLQVLGGDPLKSFDALGHPDIVIVGGKIHRFE